MKTYNEIIYEIVRKMKSWLENVQYLVKKKWNKMLKKKQIVESGCLT